MPDDAAGRTVDADGFIIYDEFEGGMWRKRVTVKQAEGYEFGPVVRIYVTSPLNSTAAPRLTVSDAKRVRDALDVFITENTEAAPDA